MVSALLVILLWSWKGGTGAVSSVRREQSMPEGLRSPGQEDAGEGVLVRGKGSHWCYAAFAVSLLSGSPSSMFVSDGLSILKLIRRYGELLLFAWRWMGLRRNDLRALESF